MNDQPLKRPQGLRKLFHLDHGLPPKSKSTSAILVPRSLHGWTVMGGYGKTACLAPATARSHRVTSAGVIRRIKGFGDRTALIGMSPSPRLCPRGSTTSA